MGTNGFDRETFRLELERVVASEALRNSESLRRLLAYLGEAHLSGSARELKEYTIGRDVMGKPPDYDPRVDASVRVQVGRLRQRLEHYYSHEAPGSPHRIELPKGHFELAFEKRPEGEGVAEREATTGRIWKAVALVLAGLCLALGAISWRLWRQPAARPVPVVASSPQLRDFWAPFLDSRRPLTIVLGSPLFVRFHSYYFRNPWLNSWDEVEKNLPIRKMQELLQSPSPPSETHRWAPFGEAVAAFRIATVLSPRRDDIMLKRSSVLSWEDIRASNLVFLGPQKFNPQLRDLPIQQDFIIDQGVVRNLRPQAGEEAIYQKPSSPEVEDIPEDYAVITRMGGVQGWGEVLVLASTSTEGTWAAADYVTHAESMSTLLGKLSAGKSALPDCYQVLLRCRFKNQVPIQAEYVTHHVVLRAEGAR